jgi:tRNA G10  N-methylase Trm11
MKHYKSVFENEQELLNSIISIHLNGENIQCDPMFFKGNFYKDNIKEPLLKFDLNPQNETIQKANAMDLPLLENSLENIILDPPFLFGIHGKTNDYYSSKTHTIFKNFEELEYVYNGILKEAYRLLNKKGILIFKCQDYTDSKTTMTHTLVYNWAVDLGFYAKDLAILVKPNKIYNGNTKQRHLRKIHTYFWIFEKGSIKNGK